MRRTFRLPALALTGALILQGCFEDGGNPATSTSTSTSADSSSNATGVISARYQALSAWADSGAIALPGDTALDPGATLRARWDSVVDLSRPGTDLRALIADWSGRTAVLSGWSVIDSSVDSSSVTRLVRFSVEGIEQGALIRAPTQVAGKLPVLLFCHPSDDGMSSLYLSIAVSLMGSLADSVLIVAPAFRGEPASLGSDTVPSPTISQSPWDRDVDDALALLTASLARYQGDPSRIAALGYSRGGGVALLASLRDARIGSVFDISGPTDLFAPSFQRVAIGLLNGGSSTLPGISVLDTLLLKPFAAGKISADSLRRGMLRRSPARWARSGLLPATQAVHGSADSTVNIDQSEALVAASSQASLATASGSSHFSVLFSQTLQAQLGPFLRSHLWP